MSRYRKIEVKTWADQKFRRLSPMPPSAQGLWLFLMTGPHTGPIPGLFRAGRASMAEELDWDIEAFDGAFREVFDQGMAKADFKARLVWLPNALKHNKPESPNVVRSWRVELDLLPECDLKNEAMAHIRAHLEDIGPAYVEAFDEILGKPRKTERKPSAKPSSKAMANQEQEQEQEQETHASADALVLTADGDEPAEPGEIDRGVPACPVQQLVDAYHELMPTNPRVKVLDAGRRKSIGARWREAALLHVGPFGYSTREEGLSAWREFFATCSESAFLTGRTAPSPGRAHPFVATLDFLISPSGFRKCLENHYHREFA